MKTHFPKMVPSIIKCQETLRKLPVLWNLTTYGVDLCAYQRTEGQKGIDNLIDPRNRDSKEWLGIVEYLLSISPFTYELS